MKNKNKRYDAEMPITTNDFILANDIDWCEGNAIKYISRHERKNGSEDIHKAIGFLKKILREKYGEG